MRQPLKRTGWRAFLVRAGAVMLAAAAMAACGGVADKSPPTRSPATDTGQPTTPGDEYPRY